MNESRPHIDVSEVGPTLQRARADHGIDVEEAATASGLSPSTVRDLEGRDPAEWGGDMLMLARLRIYARFLGRDPEPMVGAAWRASGKSMWGSPPPQVAPLMPGATRAQQRRRRRLLVASACVAILVVAGAAVGAIRAVDDGEAATDAPTDVDEEPASQAAPDGQPGDAAETPDVNAAGEPPTTETEGALPGRSPEETPVQVLNALGDEQATAGVAAELEALGYDIVLIDATAQQWGETAVYYNAGWETEAESLQARDGRFPVGGSNDVFVDEAGLHVVVGLDWGQ